MAHYEQPKETAKKIRKRLQEEYPNLPKNHFSVRVRAGGDSIRVEWTDNPSYKEVDNIVKFYRESYVDTDGQEFYSTEYIFTEQNISEERSNAIESYIKDTYDAESAKEIISGFGPYSKRYKTISEYFDDNNELKKEHTVKMRIDVTKFRDETINNYIKNLPLGTNMPKAGIFLLGKYHKDFKTGKETIELTNKDIIAKVITELDTHSNIKEFEKHYANAVSDYDFRISIEQELNATFYTNIANYLSQYVYQHLQNRVANNCADNVEVLTAKKSPREAQNYIINNDLTDEHIFSNLNQIFKNDAYVNGYDVIDSYMDKQFYEQYGDLRKQAQTIKIIQSSDSKMVSVIDDSFENLSPELKKRHNKIMIKNDSEVLKFIENSTDKMKNVGKYPHIIKYVFKSTKETDVKIFVYQTSFGLWLVMEKEGKQPNVRNIYKLGNQTIEQSIKSAAILYKTYNLSPNVVTLAKKMYLKA